MNSDLTAISRIMTMAGMLALGLLMLWGVGMFLDGLDRGFKVVPAPFLVFGMVLVARGIAGCWRKLGE